MKQIKILTLLIFLLIPAIRNAQTQNKNSIEDFAWLSGNWEYKSPRGTVISEYWTEPAGIMLGLGRTLKSGKVRSYEYLRIIKENSAIYYVAKPASAKTETRFKLTKLQNNTATFENPEHDFPKKIIYKKISDNEIAIRVSGDNEKGFSYKMLKKNSHSTKTKN